MEEVQEGRELGGGMDTEEPASPPSPGAPPSPPSPPPQQSPPPPAAPESPGASPAERPSEAHARQVLLQEWGPPGGSLELPRGLTWTLLLLRRPLYRNLLRSPNPEGARRQLPLLPQRRLPSPPVPSRRRSLVPSPRVCVCVSVIVPVCLLEALCPPVSRPVSLCACVSISPCVSVTPARSFLLRPPPLPPLPVVQVPFPWSLPVPRSLPHQNAPGPSPPGHAQGSPWALAHSPLPGWSGLVGGPAPCPSRGALGAGCGRGSPADLRVCITCPFQASTSMSQHPLPAPLGSPWRRWVSAWGLGPRGGRPTHCTF